MDRRSRDSDEVQAALFLRARRPLRLQGVFVSDGEIQRLVDYWRQQAGQTSAYAVPSGGEVVGVPLDGIPQGVPLKQVPMFEDMSPQEKVDPLLDEAIDLVGRELERITSK